MRLCFAACQAVNGHRKASQPQNLKAGTCSHDHFQVFMWSFHEFSRVFSDVEIAVGSGWRTFLGCG